MLSLIWGGKIALWPIFLSGIRLEERKPVTCHTSQNNLKGEEEKEDTSRFAKLECRLCKSTGRGHSDSSMVSMLSLSVGSDNEVRSGASGLAEN